MAPQPAALKLTCNPAGPHFPITEQCQMPAITVTAELENASPGASVTAQYEWLVTLEFHRHGCIHAPDRVLKHDDIRQTTTTNTLQIPFTQIRGGSLTISVTANTASGRLTAATKGLFVTGTNPSVTALAAEAANNEAFRKLMRVESRLRQFLAPTCPLFSSDGFGGVGLCQLTRPQPTPEQIWSWKENVKGGWALYKSKEAIAKAYPRQVRHSTRFKRLVKAYNDERKKRLMKMPKFVPPVHDLIINLPNFTDRQLMLDTLRGFNGWAGGLHEYRVQTDRNGVLVVDENPLGLSGTAVWERVTAADRIAYYNLHKIAANHRGDPNYVSDVMSKESF